MFSHEPAVRLQPWTHRSVYSHSLDSNKLLFLLQAMPCWINLLRHKVSSFILHDQGLIPKEFVSSWFNCCNGSQITALMTQPHVLSPFGTEALQCRLTTAMETDNGVGELSCPLLSPNYGASCSDFSWFSRAYVVQLGHQWGTDVHICELTCIDTLSVSGLVCYNDTKYMPA